MAQGDLFVIDEFLEDFGLKIHQLETDAFNLGLITSATTPTVSTADPRWGAGGTTNWSTNEVTFGSPSNYQSGGASIPNPTYSQTGGTATWDGDDVSILQASGNPTNARWGIGYNDTSAGKEVVFYLDLGSDTDLSAGDFTVTWNASGIFTLT